MADTPINIGLFGTQTINASGDYAVTFLGVGTLNITGAGVVANLNTVAGIGLLETFNVQNGATANLNGPIQVGVADQFNISGGGSTLGFGSGLSTNVASQINFTGSGFGAPGGNLRLDAGLNLGLLNAPINGFGNAANSIDFSGVATSAHFTAGIPGNGTLDLVNGVTVVKTFNLSGMPLGTTDANFTVAPDGSGGTFVGFTCFLRGARIATPSGERAVEDLSIGDLVLTLAGAPAPVKWIGRRKFRAAGLANPAEGMPIRIRKDAIAPNVPHADLSISPGHCMYLEGALLPAQFLVNGVTIVQDLDLAEFEYFHIELDAHAIILAEGAPAESYLDTGNRGFFATPGVVELFPDFAPKTWDDACAPFVTQGPALVAAKRKLLARAEAFGLRTTEDPALRLRVDGRDLAPVAVEGAAHIFAIPQGFSDIRIVSRSSVAAEVAAETDDRRRLGVAVGRIVLCEGALRREIPLDHPALADGFHGSERADAEIWRWSNGEASLPLALLEMEGRSVTAIEIHVRSALPAYRLPDVDLVATEALSRIAA